MTPLYNNVFQILIQDGGKLPDELPPLITDNIDQIKRLLPQAKHNLLCGEEIRAFLQSDFGSEILETYDGLKPYAFKADLARLCYLYAFGGLYIDL